MPQSLYFWGKGRWGVSLGDAFSLLIFPFTCITCASSLIYKLFLPQYMGASSSIALPVRAVIPS